MRGSRDRVSPDTGSGVGPSLGERGRGPRGCSPWPGRDKDTERPSPLTLVMARMARETLQGGDEQPIRKGMQASGWSKTVHSFLQGEHPEVSAPVSPPAYRMIATLPCSAGSLCGQVPAPPTSPGRAQSTGKAGEDSGHSHRPARMVATKTSLYGSLSIPWGPAGGAALSRISLVPGSQLAFLDHRAALWSGKNPLRFLKQSSGRNHLITRSSALGWLVRGCWGWAAPTTPPGSGLRARGQGAEPCTPLLTSMGPRGAHSGAFPATDQSSLAPPSPLGEVSATGQGGWEGNRGDMELKCPPWSLAQVDGGDSDRSTPAPMPQTPRAHTCLSLVVPDALCQRADQAGGTPIAPSSPHTEHVLSCAPQHPMQVLEPRCTLKGWLVQARERRSSGLGSLCPPCGPLLPEWACAQPASSSSSSLWSTTSERKEPLRFHLFQEALRPLPGGLHWKPGCLQLLPSAPHPHTDSGPEGRIQGHAGAARQAQSNPDVPCHLWGSRVQLWWGEAPPEALGSHEEQLP